MYRTFAFRKVDPAAEDPDQSEPELSEEEPEEPPRQGVKRRAPDAADGPLEAKRQR